MAVVIGVLATSTQSIAGDLTESSDFRVRVQAALRLGRSGNVASRNELETGLRDAHPAVRAASAVALGSLGEAKAIAALQQAMKTESVAGVKTSMKDAIEKLHGKGASSATSAPSPVAAAAVQPNVEHAKYVVQLGNLKDGTGLRGDLDPAMRSAARAKAGTIKNAVILDAPDATILKRAGERKIPVLFVDGSLTHLSQSTAPDGALTISAQVDLSIRRVPQQTLRGTVSGRASASDDARNQQNGITELQNRAVNSAVESAMSSVGSEIAALAK